MESNITLPTVSQKAADEVRALMGTVNTAKVIVAKGGMAIRDLGLSRTRNAHGPRKVTEKTYQDRERLPDAVILAEFKRRGLKA